MERIGDPRRTGNVESGRSRRDGLRGLRRRGTPAPGAAWAMKLPAPGGFRKRARTVASTRAGAEPVVRRSGRGSCRSGATGGVGGCTEEPGPGTAGKVVAHPGHQLEERAGDVRGPRTPAGGVAHRV